MLQSIQTKLMMLRTLTVLHLRLFRSKWPKNQDLKKSRRKMRKWRSLSPVNALKSSFRKLNKNKNNRLHRRNQRSNTRLKTCNKNCPETGTWVKKKRQSCPTLAKIVTVFSRLMMETITLTKLLKTSDGKWRLKDLSQLMILTRYKKLWIHQQTLWAKILMIMFQSVNLLVHLLATVEKFWTSPRISRSNHLCPGPWTSNSKRKS